MDYLEDDVIENFYDKEEMCQTLKRASIVMESTRTAAGIALSAASLAIQLSDKGFRDAVKHYSKKFYKGIVSFVEHKFILPYYVEIIEKDTRKYRDIAAGINTTIDLCMSPREMIDIFKKACKMYSDSIKKKLSENSNPDYNEFILLTEDDKTNIRKVDKKQIGETECNECIDYALKQRKKINKEILNIVKKTVSNIESYYVKANSKKMSGISIIMKNIKKDASYIMKSIDDYYGAVCLTMGDIS